MLLSDHICEQANRGANKVTSNLLTKKDPEYWQVSFSQDTGQTVFIVPMNDFIFQWADILLDFSFDTVSHQIYLSCLKRCTSIEWMSTKICNSSWSSGFRAWRNDYTTPRNLTCEVPQCKIPPLILLNMKLLGHSWDPMGGVTNSLAPSSYQYKNQHHLPAEYYLPQNK